jgi:predicted RNA binding protein YcfA (HicA-like mRNA interferase family)
MKVREVIRDLEIHGWRVSRQSGSHRVLRHLDHPDRRVVVAGNEGKDVPAGTLAAIYRQAGIDPPGRR